MKKQRCFWNISSNNNSFLTDILVQIEIVRSLIPRFTKDSIQIKKTRFFEQTKQNETKIVKKEFHLKMKGSDIDKSLAALDKIVNKKWKKLFGKKNSRKR